MTTIAIENMKIGRRYMTCREGYEAGWTVTEIKHTADAVNVIYRNGLEVGWQSVGTEIAVFCDEEGVA